MKQPQAQWKGHKIVRVKGGFQIVGQHKVWKNLIKLTDSIK